MLVRERVGVRVGGVQVKLLGGFTFLQGSPAFRFEPSVGLPGIDDW
jgi:hypothetical protein